MPDRRSAASLRLPLPTAAPGFGGLALPGATATAPDAWGVVAVRGSDPSSPSSSGGGRGSSEKEHEAPSGSSSGPDSGSGSGPSSGSGSGSGSDSGSGDSGNPFAPPPEGQPDQPWRPRTPTGGSGDGSGQDSGGGGRWSDRQPGRSPSPFGSGSRDGNGDGRPSGPRWDPRDPGQRRARYALLSGMWSFFFALFNWPSVALLLGALSVYWGVTSLKMRGKPADPAAREDRKPGESTPAPTEAGTRQQTTAAVSGLVTAGLGLALVAAMFSARVIYSDYYSCMDHALTNATRDTCEKHLPKDLRPLLGVNDENGQ
ncbi:hypothetical protein ACFWMQ_01275 [Streptomyces sp. NPDC058372]|uniref:hypothetical protein n=1 Tax=Streptomyces sp. NPDC058372 TaxID=3346464 RepID=UPI003652963C